MTLKFVKTKSGKHRLKPAPLTDEELRMISKQQDPVVVLHHNVLAFAHAIEAAVMQRALEALVEIHPGNMTPMAEESWAKAIAALKQLLGK